MVTFCVKGLSIDERIAVIFPLKKIDCMNIFFSKELNLSFFAKCITVLGEIGFFFLCTLLAQHESYGLYSNLYFSWSVWFTTKKATYYNETAFLNIIFFYGSATKYFTSICVNPIILEIKVVRKAAVWPVTWKHSVYAVVEHMGSAVRYGGLPGSVWAWLCPKEQGR